MADYTINVDVSVSDGELTALESKINDLKSKPVEIDIKTNLSNIKNISKDISKTIESAEKTIAKKQKTQGASLIKTLFDPSEVDTKSIAKTVKGINNLIGKDLNLGEVKLSVNDSIFRELDNLQNKLNEIKTTAKSMGSIKLSVADNMTLQDGKIIVGNSSNGKTKSSTFNNQIKELKLNAKAQASNNYRRSLPGADLDALDKEAKKLVRQRENIINNIRRTGDSAKEVVANDEFNKAFNKATKNNEKTLRDLSVFNSTFEK